MCHQSPHQSNPILRRSPRLHGSSNHLTVNRNACATSRRLEYTGHGNAPLRTRRVQLHSSLEPESIPNSPDILPSANARNLTSEELSGIERPQTSPNSNDELRSPHRNSPRGAELIMDEHENYIIRASEADDKAGVFTFLSRMKVKELRRVLKYMKLKQHGNKGQMVARTMVSAEIRLAVGGTFAQIMAFYPASARYESWVQHQRALDERVPQYWLSAPNLSQLLSLLDNRESDEFKKKKAAMMRSRQDRYAIREIQQRAVITSRPAPRDQQISNTASNNVNFSISEFARLCLIIRDDEDAKAALFATGQELTRSQLEAGFSRESFWGIIEIRFNNANLQLHGSMVGNVDDIAISQPPPCHRSATFLKEIFFDARSSFTVCVENWSTSGQNDTGNFKSFAGSRNGELTEAGKRNMVLFVGAGLGTENEDSRFRSICLLTTPYGRGVDEGGSTARPKEESSVRRTEQGGSRRNSRRGSGGDYDSVDQSVVQLCEFIIERGRRRLLYDKEKLEERRERRQQRREQHEEQKKRDSERRETRKRKTNENGRLRQLEENHKLIKLLRYATETLQSQGQDPGTELVIAARRQREAVFKAFQMPENSLEGLQGDLSMSCGHQNGTRTVREGRSDRNSSSEQRRDERINRGREEEEIQPNI